MARYVDIEPLINQTEFELQHEINPKVVACTLAMLYVLKGIPVVDECVIQQAFDRLAEYENTGLSPDEIRELQKERGAIT